MDLETLGWSPALGFYLDQLADDGGPAPRAGRVASVVRGRCELCTAEDPDPVAASWRKSLPLIDGEPVTQPAVGDWCAVTAPADDARVITALLPRRTTLARGRATGPQTEQVLAANVDLALLVMGLDRDFNLRRAERYLTLCRSSDVRPVVVLNKRDLCDEQALAPRLAQVQGAVGDDVSVLALSALFGQGTEALGEELGPGVTAVLLGSSGAGKSTLINHLLGAQRQRTGAVRVDDQRGRHTTTRRELVALPGGGVVIDTPGLREVGLVGDAEAVERAFVEIAALAAGCRFADCRHEGEPGCAVAEGVARGELAGERLASYLRLRREAESAARRQSAHAQRDHERQTIARYRKQLRDHRKLRGE